VTAEATEHQPGAVCGSLVVVDPAVSGGSIWRRLASAPPTSMSVESGHSDLAPPRTSDLAPLPSDREPTFGALSSVEGGPQEGCDRGWNCSRVSMAIEFSPVAATNFPAGGRLFSPLVATNLPTNRLIGLWRVR
jgi:hypothetical protein